MHRVIHFIFAFVTVARLSGQDVAAPEPQWQPKFTGVDVAELSTGSPRMLRAVAVRIDLQAPGLSFTATPSNGPKPGETDAAYTTSFLVKNGLQAAINAAPFDKVYEKEGGPQDVRGLLVTGGEVISKPGSLPALVISRKNRARIASAPVDTKDAWTAVGGFSVVLRGGELTHTGDKKLHPRTAAGVSKDGRWLWWLVVDGRQLLWSGGVTTEEVGTWMKKLGAWDAINLDGGGTSTAVVAGPDGKPQVLNRPVHGGVPGRERVAGCHLGLKALPLQVKKAEPAE